MLSTNEGSERALARERLAVLQGGGVESLCVWNEGQARSPREAKRLLEEGCGAPGGASGRMMLFLESVREGFGELFPNAAFVANRVCLTAHGRGNHLALRELADLALCLGLSVYEAPQTVRVAIRADDALALSQAAFLLCDEQALELTARRDRLSVSVRLDEHRRFEVRSATRPGRAYGHLSLLGFATEQGSTPHWHTRGNSHFEIGRLLSRAFSPMCTQDDCDLEMQIEGEQTLRLCAQSA